MKDIIISLPESELNSQEYLKENSDWDMNAVFYQTEVESPLYRMVHNKKIETYKKYISRYKVYADVGGGTGYFIKKVSNTFNISNFYLVDFSLQMCTVAKKFYTIENVYCSSCSDLPFPEGMFDGIFLNGALHHFKAQPNWENSLLEIDRVLSKGGFLFIFDRNGALLGRCLHKLAMALRNLLKKIRPSISTSASDTEPDFSLRDLSFFLNDKGYTIVERRPTSNIFSFAIVLISNTVEYTIGFRPAQYLRKILSPIYLFSQKILDIDFLCVEQCLVLKKNDPDT